MENKITNSLTNVINSFSSAIKFKEISVLPLGVVLMEICVQNRAVCSSHSRVVHVCIENLFAKIVLSPYETKKMQSELRNVPF